MCHSQCLLKCIFKRANNGHQFANWFHLTFQTVAREHELFQTSAQDLNDDIIEWQFETITVILRERVTNSQAWGTQRKQCCHKTQRVASGFWSQGGRPLQSGVHLGDTILEWSWIQIVMIALPKESVLLWCTDSRITNPMLRSIGKTIWNFKHNLIHCVHTEGSKVSMLHTVMQLSSDSSTTSYPT